MNCSGVKYIAKYIYPEDLECWIIDKAKIHIQTCYLCVGEGEERGPSIRDHVNGCDLCNRVHRIGKTTTIKGKSHAKPVPRESHPAKLNPWRYSLAPRIDHTMIPGRKVR